MVIIFVELGITLCHNKLNWTHVKVGSFKPFRHAEDARVHKNDLVSDAIASRCLQVAIFKELL